MTAKVASIYMKGWVDGYMAHASKRRRRKLEERAQVAAESLGPSARPVPKGKS